MTDDDKRQLRTRFRKLEGQIRALETGLEASDRAKFINQLEAVVAASKAALRFYIEKEILAKGELDQEDRKLLARLIEKLG